MHFRFSVDDNIWFLRDLANYNYNSIFNNEYLAVYKRLHEKYKIKIQLNLFYETEGFTLSQMTDRYKEEWISNSDWLQLSFHSRKESANPYMNSSYEEVYKDCITVHGEIVRFAGKQALNMYTTIHCCKATKDGVRALYDAGIRGLVGIFGTIDNPRLSYSVSYDEYKNYYDKPYYYDTTSKMYFFNNNMVINTVGIGEIEEKLAPSIGKDFVEIMIHEQYFYKDYIQYQPDFEKKLDVAVSYLINQGYTSVFLDEII